MTVVAVAGALGRFLGSVAVRGPHRRRPGWRCSRPRIRAVDADPGEPGEVARAVGRTAAARLLRQHRCPPTASAGSCSLQLSGGSAADAARGAAGSCALLVLTFVRPLLWARDGARLTGRLLRTEAYFRALVSSAEDVTGSWTRGGTVTWVSGAVRTQLGWAARDLDRAQPAPSCCTPTTGTSWSSVAAAVLGRRPATASRRRCGCGRRTAAGATSRSPGAARAGVPGTAPAATAWCCTCATSPSAAAASASSSGWPTPTT